MRRISTLAILALMPMALAGCVPPPNFPPQPVVLGPLNGEPWVNTQSPAGSYDTSGSHLPFQTPNSLPPGAWNATGY